MRINSDKGTREREANLVVEEAEIQGEAFKFSSRGSQRLERMRVKAKQASKMRCQLFPVPSHIIVLRRAT
jgi:hypothetical protein